MMRSVIKAVFFGALCFGTACSQSGAQAQQTSEAVQNSVAVPGSWIVDKAQSSITFTGMMSGDAFDGSFENYEASIVFDPDDLAAAKINVSIDMASVDANDEERNDALPGKEWFAIKSFPKAEFTSMTVKKVGDDQYEVAGELQIKDIRQPIILPFTLKIQDSTARATGQTSINRTDFAVGTGMWKSEDWVDHKVDIKISVTATSN